MTAADWDIDGIVREVLQRLRDDPAVQSVDKPAADVQPPRTEEKQEKVDPRELIVSDRVVSMAAVDGRLSGMQRLVTRPDAVVTPSVRDELRTRRIKLVCRSDSPNGGKTDTQVVLTTVGSATDGEQAARSMTAAIGKADRIVAEDLPTAIRRTADKITGGAAIGVLLTNQPVAASCLANQVRGVRAAWGVDGRSVQQAIDTIGVNLLVVAPCQIGVEQATALVRQFVDSGPRPCPNDFLKMLERVR